ncbi:hypothetical protein GCM10011297_34880 [Bacterioplanes sanyensis]|nr:hypothetical protein GCM10011297_34880 [Bacterioplanes sanyensis]
MEYINTQKEYNTKNANKNTVFKCQPNRRENNISDNKAYTLKQDSDTENIKQGINSRKERRSQTLSTGKSRARGSHAFSESLEL